MFASIFNNQLNCRAVAFDQSLSRVGRAVGRFRSITSARRSTRLRRSLEPEPSNTSFINGLKPHTTRKVPQDASRGNAIEGVRGKKGLPRSVWSGRVEAGYDISTGAIMDRLKLFSIAVIGGALLAATCAVLANDSAAELSIGGLQFVRTNDVAMESEDLRISLDRVTVRYQFANTTGKPVTLTVAFPLPDIDLSEAENIALPSTDPVNFVDFETKIDGVPAQFKIDQRAMVG